ncbi:MAG: hypothetical protein LZF86_110469 [Nitrospira sp.]|nr:MAG: hypothetical protein LZF86_110469 [Nitrospira sp.]
MSSRAQSLAGVGALRESAQVLAEVRLILNVWPLHWAVRPLMAVRGGQLRVELRPRASRVRLF